MGVIEKKHPSGRCFPKVVVRGEKNCLSSTYISPMEYEVNDGSLLEWAWHGVKVRIGGSKECSSTNTFHGNSNWYLCIFTCFAITVILSEGTTTAIRSHS